MATVGTASRARSCRTHAVLSCVGLSLATLAVATGCSSAGSGAASGTSASSSASQRGGASSGTTGAGTASTVEVKNFSFEPGTLTVAVGTKVTWNFDDDSAHTVKAGDGSFTSPALQKGKSFSFTFTKPGTYQYICSIHQYMSGTVTVK